MPSKNSRDHIIQAVLKHVSVTLLLLVISHASHAVSMTHVDIDSEDGVYSIRFEMTMDVAVEYVSEVLTDYRHIYRLNPSIVESRILPAPEKDVARVYTRMEGCVFFYCSQVVRVEDVHEKGSGELVAVIVPEMSDFETGIARWKIVRQGGSSRVIYESQLKPQFFIPPLVGSFFFKEKLKDELLVVFQRVECNARARLWANRTGNEGMPAGKANSKICKVLLNDQLT